MSQQKLRHQITRTITDINALARLGRTLSDDTTEQRGDIAVLFTVIGEKGDKLDSQLQQLDSKPA